MTTPQVILLVVLLNLFGSFTKAEETCAGSSRYSSFTKIGNNYYYISAINRINWFKAVETCRRMGADLATITNENQHNAISEYLLSKGFRENNFFWTAGNDLAENRNFHWISNGEKTTYLKWSFGQPDNAGGTEHCVFLWLANGKFLMNDATCTTYAYFICQAPDPKTVCIW